MITRPKTYNMRQVVCIVMLLTCGFIAAQPRLRAPEMYIGMHGGAIASTVMFSPTVDNMSPITKAALLSGNGGLVFRYAGHKVCGLQVELNYMHRGWRESNDVASYERHLHYVELPFLMHLYFGKKATRGFFNLGPQIGVCVADQTKGAPFAGSSTQQYQAINSPIDWGVAAGLGFYVKTQKAGLYQLEARFNYSLGGLYGTKAIDYFSQANAMDLSLNVGWFWPLNRQKKQTKIK